MQYIIFDICFSWPGRGICFIFSSVEILYAVFHIWVSLAARDICNTTYILTEKRPRCVTLIRVYGRCAWFYIYYGERMLQHLFFYGSPTHTPPWLFCKTVSLRKYEAVLQNSFIEKIWKLCHRQNATSGCFFLHFFAIWLFWRI